MWVGRRGRGRIANGRKHYTVFAEVFCIDLMEAFKSYCGGGGALKAANGRQKA